MALRAAGMWSFAKHKSWHGTLRIRRDQPEITWVIKRHNTAHQIIQWIPHCQMSELYRATRGNSTVTSPLVDRKTSSSINRDTCNKRKIKDRTTWENHTIGELCSTWRWMITPLQMNDCPITDERLPHHRWTIAPSQMLWAPIDGIQIRHILNEHLIKNWNAKLPWIKNICHTEKILH